MTTRIYKGTSKAEGVSVESVAQEQQNLPT
jgi:hypothetical protein